MDHKLNTEPSHEDKGTATKYGPSSKQGTCIFVYSTKENGLTLEKGKLRANRRCKSSTVTEESRSVTLSDFKSPSWLTDVTGLYQELSDGKKSRQSGCPLLRKSIVNMCWMHTRSACVPGNGLLDFFHINSCIEFKIIGLNRQSKN